MPRRDASAAAGEQAAAPTRRPAAELPPGFDEEATRLLAHPRLRLALAHYCHGMATGAALDWPYYKLFDQLGRYLVCFMLIHNYYAWRERGGPAPTLAALQRAAGGSPRHTAGFVAALRAGRLVEVEPDPDDRRATLLRPTERVIAEIGRSQRLFVEATDIVEARSPGRGAALADPDRLGSLISRSAAYVLENGTLLHAFPAVLHFTLRDCGYPMLAAVIGRHYAATVAGAPEGVPLGRRALAERFRVSPAHVGSLFAQAEERGWFALGAAGEIASMDEDFLAQFERWSAWQMVHFERMWELVPRG
ncbi:hypothetical protein MWN33_11685 [Starkeya koreensis]|uniref:MarR family transcriptional regulator n=1 Tax=Ancylobacter koreensis TaxID=266121 RepID=A0ABT0DN20_9HYPH|nr:hypothetical protein [Ancylobacter koreensis]MCK0208688.1 hypothetical protein [Ancylobacter koreensis]